MRETTLTVSVAPSEWDQGTGKTVNKDICKYLQKKFLISAPNRSIICNRCRHVYRKERSKTASIHQRTQLSDTDSDDDFQHQKPLQTSKKPATQTSPPSIHLPISSTVKSHAYCFICKRPGPKLVVVPSDSRLSVFVEKKYTDCRRKQMLSKSFTRWSPYSRGPSKSEDNWPHILK